MRTCAVYCCTNTVGKDNCTFFGLPKQVDVLEKWKNALGRDSFSSSTVVCSLHFKDECFNVQGTRKVLSPGSVPTEMIRKRCKPEHSYSRLEPTVQVAPPCKAVKLDHNYTLPPAKELKMRVDAQVERLQKRRLHDQRQSMANLRLRKKISKLGDIITDLEKSRMVSDKAAEILACFAETSVAGNLYERMHHNKKIGCASRDAYPPELRAFAMTLSFYSSKAYRYVRETFQLALPHPSTITSWYSSINGEPGFSEECFDTLKARQMEKQQQGGSLYLALTMDEMSLMSRFEYDGTKFRGEVDLGAGLEVNDSEVLATQALVLLAVCVNQGWKLPIGFFFVHGLDGHERANLVKIALSKLEIVNVPVLSLTCDGPHTNKAMMTELGVSLDSKNIVPYFVTEAGSKIYVLLDVCHMIKLLRNAFEKQGCFLDPSGRMIEWRYLVELVRFQAQESLHCGNKLTWTHINFHRSKMSVRLATQLLSASVADAIEYCTDYLKLPQFQGSQATVSFIRRIDRLFDFCNSRNPCARNFKAPLRYNSHKLWQKFIGDTVQYIQELKSPTGTAMVHTPRRTGFTGFLLSIKAITGIYHDYVQTKKLKYLLTYKLSQDHLELYFAAVRSGLGSNNNPSCKEFINIFKKLMVRNHVKGWKGNCIALDDTVILSATSTHPRRIIDAEEVSVYRRLGEVIEHSEPVQASQDELMWMDALSPVASSVHYKDAALTYVCGFVVRMVMRTIRCPICAASLEAYMLNGLRNNYSLVAHKTRGGLLFPSPSVLRICKAVEQRFVFLEAGRTFMTPQDNYLTHHVVIPVVNELIQDAN